MARYFGGFRDRLKKKSRNLSISEKDIEWLKVATSFSWSPAKREYQWLEPEDYLSSFLSSSVSTDTEFGDVSPATTEGFAREDEIEIVDGIDREVAIEAEGDPDFMPAYGFNAVSGEDSLHGIPSDILADLPHIDEYKLEIASALQRRGIHVEPNSIQVPDELGFHLNNYHEKGRSSLDSYELRARLQYFKKQVIESYEQLSAPPGGFQVFDEDTEHRVTGENKNGLDNLDEDEKFIVSSLDRLEASLREDTVQDDEPKKEVNPSDEFIDENTGDSYSASFSIPPSSFADDSWLVLPIDSAPSQTGNSHPEEFDTGAFGNEDEIFTQPSPDPELKKKQDETKKRTPLFKSAKQPDNNGVIKAFSNLKSTSENAKQESDVVNSTDQNNILPVVPSSEPSGSPFISSELDANSDQENKGGDFSLFNKKGKADGSGGVRDRKLFDSKRKAAKEQRTEVKLPARPDVESNEPDEVVEKPPSLAEVRTEVKLPSMYRKEVVLPGQEEKGSPEPESKVDKERLQKPEIPEPESTIVMDFIDDASSDEEVSLSDLLLKLRNDSDLRGSSVDEPEADKQLPDVNEEVEDKPGPAPREMPEVQGSAPVETSSFTAHSNEGLTEPLVDPLEALAKPVSKPPTKEKGPDVNSEPSMPLSVFPEDNQVSDVVDSLNVETESSSLVIDGNDNLWQDIVGDINDVEVVGLQEPTEEKTAESEHSEKSEQNELPDSNNDLAEVPGSNNDLADTPRSKNDLVDAPLSSNETAIEPSSDTVNETMDQRRARYIEEERKKLYSLIGRLEQNTGEPGRKEDLPSIDQPQDIADVGLADTRATIEKGISDVSSVQGTEEVVEEINLPTDRAVSLMDYIDAVPEGDEETLEMSNEVEEVVDFQPQIDEVIDNLQQAKDKDITDSTSDSSVDKDLGLNMPLPRTESTSSVDAPLASRPVIPINEEEVDMPESQKDEQVPTADVHEVLEQTEEETTEAVARDDKPSTSEKPAQKPSMEFDQMGLEFENLLSVVECLAFAAEEPIPLKKVARIYSEVQGTKMPTEDEVLGVVDQLNKSYEEQGRSFRIKSWGRGIRMATHPQYANYIRALYQDNRPKKLSRTLMETLSIVAYSQPTTKPEVDFVRGVDSDYAVRKLLELGLIDIVGRSEAIGRPLLYGTSERFLDQFGLSEIEALPKLREVEELLGDPAFQKERLHLLALEGLDDQEQNQENNSASTESESKPEGSDKQD